MVNNKTKLSSIIIAITAIAFICVSFVEIFDRFENIWPDREIDLNIQITDPIEGDQTAVWSFQPEANSIESIWLFYRPIGKSQIDRRVHVSLRNETSSTPIANANTTISPEEFPYGWIHIRFPPTFIDISKQHQLEISLPDTPKGEGLSLHFNSNRPPSNHVTFNDKTFANSNIEFTWIGTPTPFPYVFLGFGTVVIALLILNQVEGRLKRILLSLASSAMILLLSLYFRDLRVNVSFGYYWPDEYIAMSQSWYRFFVNKLDFNTFVQEISAKRNGQVILFPMMIGFVQFLGATPPIAYFSVVIASTITCVTVFFTACYRLGFTSKLAYASVTALILSNPMLIRSAASLQTDIGGILFALLSVYLIVRGQAYTQRKQLFFACLTGISIYCGVMTRLALAPLIILPICLALWIQVTNRVYSLSTFLKHSLASFVAIALTLVTWWALNLFPTIQLAQDFSELEIFRSHFNWSRFYEVTAFSLHISIIPLLISLKRYRTDPRLATIAGAILGLLCILALGKIIPWHRYWAPIGILSTYFVLVYLSDFKKRSSIYLSLYTILSLLVNSFLITSHNVLEN